MINRAVIVGRLTKNPELRKSAAGNSFASFTVAVDNRSKPGEQKTASFINCITFGNTADNLAKYTRKGSLIGVEGRLQQRNYETKDGRKGSALEIIADTVQFLDPKGTGPGSSIDPTPTAEVEKDDNKNLESIDIVDDDLPF
ncbi:MAG: single-stranded DNA-binding protein [Bacilli bacterium]|jgi:single-strand DNA-binding protein